MGGLAIPNINFDPTTLARSVPAETPQQEFAPFEPVFTGTAALEFTGERDFDSMIQDARDSQQASQFQQYIREQKAAGNPAYQDYIYGLPGGKPGTIEVGVNDEGTRGEFYEVISYSTPEEYRAAYDKWRSTPRPPESWRDTRRGPGAALSIAASLAIPFAAPALASALAASTGIAALGGTAGAALTGAALGAGKAAIFDEDIATGALLGGVSGGISGYLQGAQAAQAPFGSELGFTPPSQPLTMAELVGGTSPAAGTVNIAAGLPGGSLAAAAPSITAGAPLTAANVFGGGAAPGSVDIGVGITPSLSPAAGSVNIGAGLSPDIAAGLTARPVPEGLYSYVPGSIQGPPVPPPNLPGAQDAIIEQGLAYTGSGGTAPAVTAGGTVPSTPGGFFSPTGPGSALAGGTASGGAATGVPDVGLVAGGAGGAAAPAVAAGAGGAAAPAVAAGAGGAAAPAAGSLAGITPPVAGSVMAPAATGVGGYLGNVASGVVSGVTGAFAPDRVADLILRGAGLLAIDQLAGGGDGSSALAGLSAEEQALVMDMRDELAKAQQEDENLFNERLRQAYALIGDVDYFDPEYFGLQSARRAQLQAARAKQAGLRGLTGEERAAEARRYDLETGRSTGTAYDVGYGTGLEARTRARQAGIEALPTSYPSRLADYSTLSSIYGTGATQAARAAAQRRENISGLFGGLFGSQEEGA